MGKGHFMTRGEDGVCRDVFFKPHPSSLGRDDIALSLVSQSHDEYRINFNDMNSFTHQEKKLLQRHPAIEEMNISVTSATLPSQVQLDFDMLTEESVPVHQHNLQQDSVESSLTEDDNWVFPSRQMGKTQRMVRKKKKLTHIPDAMSQESSTVDSLSSQMDCQPCTGVLTQKYTLSSGFEQRLKDQTSDIVPPSQPQIRKTGTCSSILQPPSAFSAGIVRRNYGNETDSDSLLTPTVRLSQHLVTPRRSKRSDDNIVSQEVSSTLHTRSQTMNLENEPLAVCHARTNGRRQCSSRQSILPDTATDSDQSSMNDSIPAMPSHTKYKQQQPSHVVLMTQKVSDTDSSDAQSDRQQYRGVNFQYCDAIDIAEESMVSDSQSSQLRSRSSVPLTRISAATSTQRFSPKARNAYELRSKKISIRATQNVKGLRRTPSSSTISKSQ